MKKTVLSFAFNASHELLMIFKKTGQGAGKWNVPGGKIEANETPRAAAIRETQEETGIILLQPELVGELSFLFPHGGSWESTCSVFTAHSFAGEMLRETAECRPEWIPQAKIPWDTMWESDLEWIPWLLSGKKFRQRYVFDAQDRLLRSEPWPLDESK